MLLLLLAAAVWDQRVVYERYPPLWTEVPSKLIFAWLNPNPNPNPHPNPNPNPNPNRKSLTITITIALS